MSARISHTTITLVLCTTLMGCGGGDEPGTLRVTTWGEEFIEEEIAEEEFADGFSAKFDRFLLVLGNVRATQDSEVFADETLKLVNLVQPGPHELEVHSLKSGHWAELEYTIAPITSETVLHSTATAADRELMQEGPYSIYVEGSASRDDETYTFAWAFDSTTRYTNCVAEVDGRERPGFSVGAGATTTIELTIHGDHFFYDDLVADDAELRFEALAAADEDGDGDITLDELAEVSLIDLPAGSYGTGNYSNVNDLRAFVAALVTNLGHFDGEGHCTPR